MRLQADRRILRLSRDAAFLGLAMIVSYVEHLLPLSLVIPLPGVKLGLAHVVIALLFCLVSPLDAGIVSLLRVVLSALLFGTPVSFLLSLSGAAISYLFLWAERLGRGRRFSMIGLSALSSFGHHIGQMLAAVLLFGPGTVVYLPVLLAAGTGCGILTGWLMNLLMPRLEKLMKRTRKT